MYQVTPKYGLGPPGEYPIGASLPRRSLNYTGDE